ncbi:hypothetical protein J6590_088793 [Homalodisca vitripennis]|nr:hypothetical protein J6590_088793 [Homalodisca vitripennis]
MTSLARRCYVQGVLIQAHRFSVQYELSQQSASYTAPHPAHCGILEVDRICDLVWRLVHALSLTARHHQPQPVNPWCWASRDTLQPGKYVAAILPDRYDLDPDYPVHDEIALMNTSIKYGIGRKFVTGLDQYLTKRGKRLLVGIIVRVASMSHLKAASPSLLPPLTPPLSLQHISYAEAMKSESAATVSHEVSMVTLPGVLSHESLAGVTEPPDTRRVYDSQALNLQIRNIIVREPNFW